MQSKGKKTHWHTINIKVENDELKKVCIKIVCIIISMA